MTEPTQGPTDPTPTAEAWQAIAAAEAWIFDPAIDEARGRRAALEALERVGRALGEDELARWAARWPQADQRALAALQAGPPADPGARRAAARLLRLARRSLDRPRLPVRLLFWAAPLVLLAAAMAGALRFAHWRGIPGAGPWLAVYYPRPDFTGRPERAREALLDHDWTGRPPHPELPPKRFSAQYWACLELARAATIPFQLIAKDRARLLIDEVVVIDAWAPSPRDRVAAAEVPLEPGKHLLRVDYSHDKGTPRLTLTASLDGGPPQPIAPGELRAPRGSPPACE